MVYKLTKPPKMAKNVEGNKKILAKGWFAIFVFIL